MSTRLASRLALGSLVLLTVWACDEDTAEQTPADATADAIRDAMDGRDANGDAMADAMLAIDGPPEPDAEPDAALDPDRPPLFHAGCPRPGRALVRQLAHPEARVEGPDALGGAGDWLLANEHAAFVITGDGPQRTYYYYPGVPVDAVALDGCRQVGQERFEEIGWLVGAARLQQFSHSTLRAFHGTDWQVIEDGRDGGDVRLRVTGVDDIQWLVENELLRAAHREGDPRAPSVALGVELIIDYVLSPDSPVMRVEIGIRNLNPDGVALATLAMAQFGDTAPTTWFEDRQLDAQGFTVARGLPWIASHAPDGAWAVAMAGRSTSSAHISGVDALFDLNELLSAPFIRAEQTRVTTWLLAVGPDLDGVTRALHAANPDGLRGEPYMLGVIEGRVVDPAGVAVPDATVTVELPTLAEDWSPIHVLRADADGAFTGMVPDLGEGLRLRVDAPGRDPVLVEPAADAPGPVTVEVGPAGAIVHRITDAEGAPMPALVELWRGDRRAARWATRAVEAREPVAPGDYQIVVTRGFEHRRHVEDITVPPDGEVRVEAALPRVVDTTGWLTTDTHAHASPSSDSDVSLAERVAHAAAAGIEVAVGTDHEIVSDWNVGIAEAGLVGHITALSGQEVTATTPEHINAYPFERIPEAPRGAPVVWYGLDIGAVYAAIHDRGAPIAQLNHPRGGCNYMCLIDYDRLTGTARLDDPTLLGMAADAELWSWDFQAFELMNGPGSPFLDPARPTTTGLFEDWQSFLNHGHRVTAVGVSDVHRLGQGNPITYFAAPTDDPADFESAMLADALLDGRAVVSAGAFIDATIDGQGPGSLAEPGGPIELAIRVQALPEIDVRQVVVYANCDQVAAIEADAPDAVVKLDAVTPLALDADAHITVAAFGRDAMPRGLDSYDPRATPRAITNAIYVDVDGDGAFTAPGGKTCEYAIPAR